MQDFFENSMKNLVSNRPGTEGMTSQKTRK
jgi:hypothetical protein